MRDYKHTNSDLAQMQSLPLSAKLIMTRQRIKAWYEAFDGDVYVCVSGGKDSQVLAHIISEMYPDVRKVFVNTGLEYDSVRQKGIEICGDDILTPKMDFLNVVKKYGYPIISKEVAQALHEIRIAKEHGHEPPKYRMDRFTGNRVSNDGSKSHFNNEKYAFLLDAPFRISHRCCDVMKKNVSKSFENQTGLKPFIGTMASESRLREQKWKRDGCNAFDAKRPTSQPLSFWTDQDIYQYILENGLDIASIYGNIQAVDNYGMVYDTILPGMKLTTSGVYRTGCIFCMFTIAKENDKFLKLKEQEPHKYDYVMRGGKFDDKGYWIPDGGLGYKFVIDWINEHSNLDIKY